MQANVVPINPKRLFMVTVTACVMGIGACGGSSKSASPSASASSPGSAKQDVAADKAAAEAAILKLSDFPAGWTSKPPSASIGNASIDTQLGIISSDRSASYIQAVYNAVGGLRRQLAREPIVP